MKKALVAGALAVPLVALAAYFTHRPFAPAGPPASTEATASGLHAGSFEPPRDAPTFSLDGSNGRRFSLKDYAGKVVILEFGFTYCQHVCPITLARLTDAHRKLGDKADEVQLIFVTVDPKRDSTARLHEYLEVFNPKFLGATGTNDELAAMYREYGIVAKEVASKNPALRYEVDHSSFLYLIDRQGKIRGLVPFGRSADEIAHDLEVLMGSAT